MHSRQQGHAEDGGHRLPRLWQTLPATNIEGAFAMTHATRPPRATPAPAAGALPRVRRSLPGLALVTLFACMQTPALQNTADTSAQTGVNTAAISPSSANPNVAATNPNGTQGTFTSVGQGAQASMTIASHAATDFCVTTNAPSGAAGTPNFTTLVLRQCTGALEQRWVLVNGQLQTAAGQCLALGTADPSSAAYQPVLAQCAPQDFNQQMVVMNSAIYAVRGGNQYALTTHSTANSQALLQFWPASLADANGLTWDFGQYSQNDAGVAQVAGTTLIALELAPNGCLTQNANTTALSFGPCRAADSTLAWRLTGTTGTLNNLGRCLDANNGTVAMALCNGSLSQNWAVNQGLLVASTAGGNCLVATAQSGAALGPCDQAQGPHMILGLSL